MRALSRELRTRIAGRVISLIVIFLVGVVSLVGGCHSDKPPNDPAATNGARKGDVQKRCDELLGSAFNMLQPDRLGITSDAETAAALLNQWLPSCAPSPGADGALSSSAKTFLQTLILQTLIGPDAVQRAEQPRFSPRDAQHVRNCLLAKSIKDAVIRPAKTDLDRVVRLFDYVCRNVALADDESETLPLTPYEILLFGRGSAADRAWVFADLLRQMRIDAIILRPGPTRSNAGQPENSTRWLVGVLLEGKVYLFDPRLGWPIPAAADSVQSPTVQRPATLSDVQTDDSLLRQLDVDADRPYPWTAEDLAGVRAEVITHRSFWTSRIKALQNSLSGERSAVIYDGLDDDETGRGLITRVAAFGKGRWDRNQIGLWPHPEKSFHGFDHLDDQQSPRLLVRRDPFQAPVPLQLVRTEAGNIQIAPAGPPQRDQLKIRTAQLLGSYESAVRSYLQIRRAGAIPENVPVPLEIRRMHARAAEDAFFWIGVCQFEQGDFAPAAATFRDYLNRYQDGVWTDHCRGLLGLALAHQGLFAEAVAELETIPTEAPEWFGYQLWKKRWRRLSKK